MQTEEPGQHQGARRGKRLEATQVQVDRPEVADAAQDATGPDHLDLVEPTSMGIAPHVPRIVAQRHPNPAQTVHIVGRQGVPVLIAAPLHVGPADPDAPVLAPVVAEPGADFQTGLAKPVELVLSLDPSQVQVQ